MRRMNGVLLLVFLLCLGVSLPAEHMPNPETESTVPELIDFHDIIYPIWHTAYPAKDYKALRGFVTEINDQTAKINAAALPGILREKEQVWKNGLAEFNQAVEAYGKAAAGGDDQALLDAAELLHSRFEMLVRAIRPVAREVDAYHKVLYVVFHEYLPEKKYTDICKVAPDMVAKAEAITRVVFFKDAKAKAFQDAAVQLLDETKLLEAAGKSCLDKEIIFSVDRVHVAFQALQQVFD